ncbi:MAG: hydroxyisourate hydrolase [Acidiferrobacterales bacterium]|nr:hydroxyisourate hydrolase [Acidiferrobacterales bacterium]
MNEVPITSHILDLNAGRPAAGVKVTLVSPNQDTYHAVTDKNGRVNSWDNKINVVEGNWQIRFATDEWFASCSRETFYSEVTIAFKLQNPKEHYHLPLLLDSFGYSTYRGS